MSASSLSLTKFSLWDNRKCLFICALVAMANTQFGLDTAAVGGLQAMPGFFKVSGYADPNLPMGYGIDSTVQQLMSSLMTLGSMVSAIFAGLFASYFGRRTGLWCACILNGVGAAIQIAATSAGVLYVGRVFLGFANGFLVTFSTVYTAEAAPAHLRGVLVALFAYFVSIGSIIGSLIDNYSKDHMSKLSYQIPLACLFIVPTILGIGLFFVPESPRWLLHTVKTEDARRSLEDLRSVKGDELELEWSEMIRGLEEERRTASITSFMDMFKGHDLRRTLLCYAGLGVKKTFQFTIMNPCLGWIGTNIGMYLMRRHLGRRSILIWGAITCGLCELACGIAASVDPLAKETGTVLVAFTALFMFFYCGGNLDTWTMGSAIALGHLLAWLSGFCSPYFINPQDLNWGPKYTYIWAGSNFICVLFFYLFFPELKDRSLEEIDEIFENGVSAKNFPQYQCQIVEDAKQDVLTQGHVQVSVTEEKM